MGQIFISYRRSDASGHAGRLRDRLRAHFGQDVVFQDVDNIPDGEEFAKVIERALDSCKVALVVIGRNWIDAQSTRGVRRFDDPDDWVRTEVGILLRRGIRVVPVLVQGAAMPRREDLPEELKDLAGRNARELRDSAWDADISLLLRSLEPVVGSRRKRNLAVAAGIAALAVAGLMYFGPYVEIWVGKVAVPDVEGKTVEMAREVLTRDGFKNVHVETVPSADFGPGRIVRTDPPAGTQAPPATRVTVFASRGAAATKQEPAPARAEESSPPKGGVTVPSPVTRDDSVTAAPPKKAAAALRSGPVEVTAPPAVPPPPAPVAPVAAAARSVAGTWDYTQNGPRTVVEGVLTLVEFRTSVDDSRSVSGHLVWSGSGTKASVWLGKIEGDTISFELVYREGQRFQYRATLDPSRTRMTNGEAVLFDGARATWTATRRN